MKVSVITVCYNSAKTIEKTIQSVLNQTYKNIEYIIIDGNSSDNTLEIIEKYKNQLAFFVSEKDNGIYNAMNKGIKAATGDILFFLNSDDIFIHDNVIKIVSEKINSFKQPFVSYGDIIYLNSETGVSALVAKTVIDNSILFNSFIPHQATFYSTDIFKKYGNYSEDYKMVSDHDLTLNLIFNHKVKYHYINVTIAIFSSNGMSSNPSGNEVLNKERQALRKKYFNRLENIFYNRRVVRVIYRLVNYIYSSRIR